ncbi:photosystem Q(B) protein [Calothrix sp. NIES-4071]|nr:photosystem Q(B) protein [Calothrix sp. NIES-4071]BAZ62197.1 photosystem Q(B) protein [Calothrix sp. NIES-4105]
MISCIASLKILLYHITLKIGFTWADIINRANLGMEVAPVALSAPAING